MPGPEVTSTPGFAGGLGIAFRHMARALLMAGQDDFNVFLLMKHVENFQHDTTRERKNGLDTFPL